MNQRIQELAEQARKHFPKTETSGEFWVFDEQKFAELIVRECANAIVNDSRLSDVRTARNGCVRTIKEHFGVEE
jgi:hypothetical protein